MGKKKSGFSVRFWLQVNTSTAIFTPGFCHWTFKSRVATVNVLDIMYLGCTAGTSAHILSHRAKSHLLLHTHDFFTWRGVSPSAQFIWMYVNAIIALFRLSRWTQFNSIPALVCLQWEHDRVSSCSDGLWPNRAFCASDVWKFFSSAQMSTRRFTSSVRLLTQSGLVSYNSLKCMSPVGERVPFSLPKPKKQIFFLSQSAKLTRQTN